MPASAPIGVKNAPTFEPIIVANTASVAAPPDEPNTDANSTLIGMLFIKFAAKNEVTPYFKIGKFSPNVLPMISVTPTFSNSTMITNIDTTKGIN